MGRKKYPEYEAIDVPRNFVDLAERRTDYLFHVMRFGQQSLKLILASAYLQGVNDGATAIEHKHEREQGPAPEPLPLHC